MDSHDVSNRAGTGRSASSGRTDSVASASGAGATGGLSDDPDDRGALFDGIDRAALVLAVIAGAIGVMSSDDDWGPVHSFEGVLLLAIVLGFHRPMPRAATPRIGLMRAAFGLAVSFSLCITVGWPVVRAGGDVYQPGWVAGFFVLGVVLAVLEPSIARALDYRPRRVRER